MFWLLLLNLDFLDLALPDSFPELQTQDLTWFDRDYLSYEARNKFWTGNECPDFSNMFEALYWARFLKLEQPCNIEQHVKAAKFDTHPPRLHLTVKDYCKDSNHLETMDEGMHLIMMNSMTADVQKAQITRYNKDIMELVAAVMATTMAEDDWNCPISRENKLLSAPRVAECVNRTFLINRNILHKAMISQSAIQPRSGQLLVNGRKGYKKKWLSGMQTLPEMSQLGSVFKTHNVSILQCSCCILWLHRCVLLMETKYPVYLRHCTYCSFEFCVVAL